MPVRPLLELRSDLIDTIVSYGFSFDQAARIADSVISPSGQVQDPTLTYAGVVDTITQMSNVGPLSPAIQALRGALDANRLAGAVPVLPNRFIAGLATQVDRTDFIHPVSILASITTRKPSGKPIMWEGGPPQPGWLVPRLILAKRTTDQLFFVSGLFDKVHLRAQNQRQFELTTRTSIKSGGLPTTSYVMIAGTMSYQKLYVMTVPEEGRVGRV